MLTNLDWIGTGKPFPPPQEEERLKRYRKNEKLFEGKHKELFNIDFLKIESYLKKKHLDAQTIINYLQLLSRNTADFVCGEPPSITVKKQQNDELNDALDMMNFDTLLYESIIDVSRFGDAPIKIMNDRVSSVSPDCWFPIVDPTDLKYITHHVIAFMTNPDEKGNYKKIYFEIHAPGTAEVRTYEIEGNTSSANNVTIGKLIEAESKQAEQTGIDGFAVKVLKNVSHSKSVFGTDDYGIVESLVKGIMWRLKCIDNVLDKHSEPSLTGPSSALSLDEKTGLYYLDLGNYFKRGSNEDPNVEYITWDGNLDAAFKALEFMVEQLYILSEMGAAFMEGGGQGTAQSGTAIKLRMTSPRIKAQRIAGMNTQTVKQLISIIAQISNVGDVDVKDVAIDWNDGIPDDIKEKAEILIMANGGQPIESQLSTIKTWNNVDDDEAENIHAEILAAQAAQSPFLTGTGVNADGPDRKADQEV